MTLISPTVFCGIDVAKATLDLFIGQSRQFCHASNDAAGIATFMSLLGEQIAVAETALIVIEATGGYEAAVALQLASAGYQVAVVNPKRVREYARAIGRIAKTDRIDAEVLAGFAAAIKPEVRPLQDEQITALSALVTRRRQLIEMVTAEKNRKGQMHASLQKEIAVHVRWLERQITKIDDELDTLIKQTPLWCAESTLLESVKGVGKILSRTLIAELPELGKLSNKKLSALVGLAPYNRDSGKHKGKRVTGGGRAPVRAVLYMATLSALRSNAAIRPFYERLRAAGKPPKVAIVAAMRKLLTILNAMVRNNTPWDDSLAPMLS